MALREAGRVEETAQTFLSLYSARGTKITCFLQKPLFCGEKTSGRNNSAKEHKENSTESFVLHSLERGGKRPNRFRPCQYGRFVAWPSMVPHAPRPLMLHGPHAPWPSMVPHAARPHMAAYPMPHGPTLGPQKQRKVPPLVFFSLNHGKNTD